MTVNVDGLEMDGTFPPNPTIGKSPSRVIEGTNTRLGLYNNDGSSDNVEALSFFFTGQGQISNDFFEPKIYYDRNPPNPHLYVTALQKNDSTRTSTLWYAVSRNADPPDLRTLAGKGLDPNWCFYSFDARQDASTANVSFAEFDQVGAGVDALVITTNQFSFGSSSFTGAVVHVIDKAALANNAASCPTAKRTVFRPKGFTLQPVQHLTKPSSFTGTTNPAYIVSSDVNATNNGISNLYHVYRVRNVGAGSPTLQGPVDVAGSYTYSIPPQAPQNGAAQTLDTGDARILQAGGLGNVIWAVHTTGCVIGGTTSACARTVRLTVGQDGSGNPTANLAQQTVFGFSNAFLFEPGVAVNLYESVAVPFQLAGQGRYLGAFWTEKDPNASTFFSMSRLAQGACAQTESDQTGKYTGAATDPATLRLFYMAAEATNQYTSSGQPPRCLWRTRIGAVDPGFPLTTPP